MWGFGPYAGYDMMGGWGWIWGLLWLGLLAFIAYLIYRAVLGSRHLNESKQEDRSLRILKERYAKGELDKEAYEQMKKDLGEDG